MRITAQRYNCFANAFSASLDVDEASHAKTVPSWIFGPRNLDMRVVTKKMRQKALGTIPAAHATAATHSI